MLPGSGELAPGAHPVSLQEAVWPRKAAQVQASGEIPTLSLLTPIILQYVPSETLAPCHVIAEWILMGEIRNVSLCH